MRSGASKLASLAVFVLALAWTPLVGGHPVSVAASVPASASPEALSVDCGLGGGVVGAIISGPVGSSFTLTNVSTTAVCAVSLSASVATSPGFVGPSPTLAANSTVQVTLTGAGNFTLTSSAPGAQPVTFSIVIGQPITVPEYRATFEPNGGACSNGPLTVEGIARDWYRMPTEGTGSFQCSRNDYQLAGWSYDANSATADFGPGSPGQFHDSLTLFAVWIPLGVEVVYDANIHGDDPCIDDAGTNVPLTDRTTEERVLFAGAGHLLEAEPACHPGNPELVFTGWALSGDGPVAFQGGQPLSATGLTANSAVVLYAKWETSKCAIPAGPNVDWSGCDKAGSDLTKANLSGANLTKANLSGANLTKANLTKANLSGANLTKANLTGAQSIQGGGYLVPVTELAPAQLTGANLTGVNLTNINLSDKKLSGVNFTKANLSSASLSGADLTDATFAYTNLSGAELSGADLSGAKLSVVRMINQARGAKFVGATLTDVTFMGGWSYFDMSGADFSDATLTRVGIGGPFNATLLLAGGSAHDLSFRGASVTDSFLGGIARADFSNATVLTSKILGRGQINFSNANLTGSRLTDNFNGSNFTDANLRRTRMLGSYAGSAFTGAVLAGATVGNPGPVGMDCRYQGASFAGAVTAGVDWACGPPNN